MARGVNKVILIGNIGQDPEVRNMPNGTAVCNVSLATSESWKDKNTGRQQERTEWHRLVFFGRQAEIAGQYLGRGKRIYVEGKLQTRSWEQDGIKRYSTEIVCHDMQFLFSPPEGRQQGGGCQSRQQASRHHPQQAPARQPQPDYFDDDIPF